MTLYSRLVNTYRESKGFLRGILVYLCDLDDSVVGSCVYGFDFEHFPTKIM